MNWRILASAVVLLGSACASDAQSARQMFRQIDQNRDRALQFTEIQAARAVLFDRLDRNRNGTLDPEEVQTAAQRMRGAQGVQAASLEGLGSQVARMDTNGDGRILRDEFSRFIPDRLWRADTNGDRLLSLSELRALRQR